jgi:hypothetical protein
VHDPAMSRDAADQIGMSIVTTLYLKNVSNEVRLCLKSQAYLGKRCYTSCSGVLPILGLGKLSKASLGLAKVTPTPTYALEYEKPTNVRILGMLLINLWDNQKYCLF